MMTAAPMFLRDVLGFGLATTGFLGSLPYLVRWVCSLLFALVADHVRSLNVISVMNLRRISAVICKRFCCILTQFLIHLIAAHIIPGLFLIGLPYVASEPYLCVAFMTLSMSFNGAVAQSTLSNFHDLSPNFAPSLLSLINGVGISSGFLSPLVVTYFTAERVHDSFDISNL